MRGPAAPRLLLVAAALGLAGAAHGRVRAQRGRASLIAGDHGTVLTLPRGYRLRWPPHMVRDGDRLILDLPGAGNVLAAPGPQGGAVSGLQGGQDRVTMILIPGGTPRLTRHGATIRIDVTAAAAAMPATAVPQAMPAVPAAAPARAAPVAPAAPVPQAAPAAGASAPDERAATVADPDGGAALIAMRLPGPGSAILLPFGVTVGAASFAYGGLAQAVFDEGKAIDLSGLKDDPVFSGARITLAPGTTRLSMKLAPGARLGLHRAPGGWALSVESGSAAPVAPAAPVRLRAGVVSIAMPYAADSLVVVDSATGGRLLVGTVHNHGGAVLVPHSSPEFVLLPTWDGVAVLAVSDRLTLDPVKAGFTLKTASGAGLVTVLPDLSELALESAGSLTRHFDFPPLPVPALLRRMDGDIDAAAAAPKQARFGARLRAAQDMLALGLDREAEAVLQVARLDDPSQTGRPEADALLAMAGWLARRDTVAAGAVMVNPALGGSDEIALWQALMAPPGVDDAARAAVLAADWRLLTVYPAPLRRLLMPAAAALMLDGGQVKAAADLLDGDDDPALRARLLTVQGKMADALAALDRMAAGQDRRRAAQALRDATDMRLRAGTISPTAAAALLQARLFVWRAPAFELATRLRIGALLAQANDFRGALAALRQADAIFPEAHDQILAAEQEVVRALARAGASAALSPVDLVALVDENTDLLGQGDIAASLTPVLVDKLAALDLPERAEKLMEKPVESATGPVPKAAFGARLAGFRLDDGDAAGALAALDQTEAEALPDALGDRRVVVRARALAALGETAPALSLLAASDSDDALQLQADLLTKSKDWHGAKGVLQRLVRRLVPASGVLQPAQQDLVMRLASAASLDGDGSMLHDVAAGFGGRLTGTSAALFGTLNAQPVAGLADLPRAGQEAAASRALPAALASDAIR